jgi:hypothetical protein
MRADQFVQLIGGPEGPPRAVYIARLWHRGSASRALLSDIVDRAQEATPWRAVQRAAWEVLYKEAA